jgi:GTP cyclohydrolase FolE2
MNGRESLPLPDVQSSGDPRQIAIDRVGVRGLRHPLLIATPGGPLATVAHIDMTVALPADRKGTHMSRFVEVLQTVHEPLSGAGLRDLLAHTVRTLDAREGSIEIRFPYFITKYAPVSGVPGLLDYDVILLATLSRDVLTVRQKVIVPVTSLCPCSKKVSDYGAHNQRSHVTIEIVAREDVSIEEQVRYAEDAASCELYSVLKRPDEKEVTERAYDNPKFVEDMVRDVAIALRADRRIISFRVESENFESIHNHSAYAVIEQGPRG